MTGYNRIQYVLYSTSSSIRDFCISNIIFLLLKTISLLTKSKIFISTKITHDLNEEVKQIHSTKRMLYTTFIVAYVHSRIGYWPYHPGPLSIEDTFYLLFVRDIALLTRIKQETTGFKRYTSIGSDWLTCNWHITNFQEWWVNEWQCSSFNDQSVSTEKLM